MVMSWFCHGFVMVLSWLCHGFVTVLSWFCHGFAMVMIWFCHGCVMVLSWFCHGFVIVLLWFLSIFAQSKADIEVSMLSNLMNKLRPESGYVGEALLGTVDAAHMGRGGL